MHSITDKEFGTISEICSVVIPNEPPSLSLHSIRTKGAIPSPRSSFSLCKFSPTHVFLNGGADEEDDLKDAYVLDLTLMSWSKLDISIKFPLVGHCSAVLHKSLNQTKPTIYIFGGWDGSSYFNKGILIDPQDYKVQITSYDESSLDSNYEQGNSHMSLSNPNPKTLLKSVSLLVSPTKKPPKFTTATPTAGDNKSLIFREAFNSSNSGTASISKRITWFGTTGSDKGKSGSTFKIGFDGRMPSARKDHTLTVDPKGQRVFLYGGWNSFGDESDLVHMWVLGSNWQWTKLAPKGDIPPARRGHTSVCLDKEEAMIIYGGCLGNNAILDDCYKYNIQTNCFQKIKGESKFYPEGRAWHSAIQIDQWIYYYGGLKSGFKATNEVVAFDFQNHQWFNLNYAVDSSIQDIKRFGHGTFNIDTNILVLGGTAYKPTQNVSAWSRPKEKKVSLEEILVFETYSETPLDLESLKAAFPQKKEKERVYAIDEWGMSEVKPPAIPVEFQDPKKLLEEQANFWHWNPSVFPAEANKRKIHYFKQKAEEEARKSKNSNLYVEFDDLEDDESSSPTLHKENRK